MGQLPLLLSARFAVLVTGCLLSGCDQVWGPYSIVDPNNCAENLTICQPGQHCNRFTQACEDNVNLFPNSAPPSSFILPGGQVSTLTFPCTAGSVMAPCPADVHYELGAPQPPGQPKPVIYYTTDGSMPGGASTMSGPSPQPLGTLPGPTTINWYADYGAPFGKEPVRTFTANTTLTPPTDYGSFAQSLSFATSGGPIVVAPEGAHLAFQVTFQVWTSTPSGMCPTCNLQWVLSIPGVGPVFCQDKLERVGPFPGEIFTVYGTMNGPYTTGVFPLVAGLTTAQSCDGSVAMGPDVGEMFVEQM